MAVWCSELSCCAAAFKMVSDDELLRSEEGCKKRQATEAVEANIHTDEKLDAQHPHPPQEPNTKRKMQGKKPSNEGPKNLLPWPYLRRNFLLRQENILKSKLNCQCLLCPTPVTAYNYAKEGAKLQSNSSNTSLLNHLREYHPETLHQLGISPQPLRRKFSTGGRKGSKAADQRSTSGLPKDTQQEENCLPGTPELAQQGENCLPWPGLRRFFFLRHGDLKGRTLPCRCLLCPEDIVKARKSNILNLKLHLQNKHCDTLTLALKQYHKKRGMNPTSSELPWPVLQQFFKVHKWLQEDRKVRCRCLLCDALLWERLYNGAYKLNKHLQTVHKEKRRKAILTLPASVESDSESASEEEEEKKDLFSLLAAAEDLDAEAEGGVAVEEQEESSEPKAGGSAAEDSQNVKSADTVEGADAIKQTSKEHQVCSGSGNGPADEDLQNPKSPDPVEDSNIELINPSDEAGSHQAKEAPGSTNPMIREAPITTSAAKAAQDNENHLPFPKYRPYFSTGATLLYKPYQMSCTCKLCNDIIKVKGNSSANSSPSLLKNHLRICHPAAVTPAAKRGKPGKKRALNSTVCEPAKDLPSSREGKTSVSHTSLTKNKKRRLTAPKSRLPSASQQNPRAPENAACTSDAAMVSADERVFEYFIISSVRGDANSWQATCRMCSESVPMLHARHVSNLVAHLQGTHEWKIGSAATDTGIEELVPALAASEDSEVLSTTSPVAAAAIIHEDTPAEGSGSAVEGRAGSTPAAPEDIEIHTTSSVEAAVNGQTAEDSETRDSTDSTDVMEEDSIPASHKEVLNTISSVESNLPEDICMEDLDYEGSETHDCEEECVGPPIPDEDILSLELGDGSEEEVAVLNEFNYQFNESAELNSPPSDSEPECENSATWTAQSLSPLKMCIKRQQNTLEPAESSLSEPETPPPRGSAQPASVPASLPHLSAVLSQEMLQNTGCAEAARKKSGEVDEMTQLEEEQDAAQESAIIVGPEMSQTLSPGVQIEKSPSPSPPTPSTTPVLLAEPEPGHTTSPAAQAEQNPTPAALTPSTTPVLLAEPEPAHTTSPAAQAEQNPTPAALTPSTTPVLLAEPEPAHTTSPAAQAEQNPTPAALTPSTTPVLLTEPEPAHTTSPAAQAEQNPTPAPPEASAVPLLVDLTEEDASELSPQSNPIQYPAGTRETPMDLSAQQGHAGALMGQMLDPTVVRNHFSGSVTILNPHFGPSTSRCHPLKPHPPQGYNISTNPQRETTVQPFLSSGFRFSADLPALKIMGGPPTSARQGAASLQAQPERSAEVRAGPPPLKILWGPPTSARQAAVSLHAQPGRSVEIPARLPAMSTLGGPTRQDTAAAPPQATPRSSMDPSARLPAMGTVGGPTRQDTAAASLQAPRMQAIEIPPLDPSSLETPRFDPSNQTLLVAPQARSMLYRMQGSDALPPFPRTSAQNATTTGQNHTVTSQQLQGPVFQAHTFPSQGLPSQPSPPYQAPITAPSMPAAATNGPRPLSYNTASYFYPQQPQAGQFFYVPHNVPLAPGLPPQHYPASSNSYPSTYMWQSNPQPPPATSYINLPTPNYNPYQLPNTWGYPASTQCYPPAPYQGYQPPQ